MKYSLKINLYRVLIVLVLVGALNWGLVSVFNFDLVKGFSSIFGENLKGHVSFLIYMVVAVSAVILVIQRDTYLPFLGYTVMPKPMTEFIPTGDLKTKVVENLPANVKVAYWAALPSDKVVDNPDTAYGEYTNQGVTTTDAKGVATLKVLNPASYKVPLKGTLEPHIHYRYWDSNGMASRLHTIKL